MMEMRMQIVAPLWRKNWSELEIRDEVMKRLNLKTLSSRTIHEDIQRLCKELREARMEDTEAVVSAELHRIDLVIRNAWDAWEASLQDTEQKRTKRKGLPEKDDEGNETITTLFIEQTKEENIGRGEPRYLDIILRALERRQRLLGLDRVSLDLSGGITAQLEITHAPSGFTPASSEDEVRRREGITD
jgi:hypothetical protein